MKILIYVWALNNGGAERVAALWSKGFSQDGHKVSIALESLEPRIDYEIGKNVSVLHRFPKLNQILTKLRLGKKVENKIIRIVEFCFRAVPVVIRRRILANIIAKESPDVIIVVMQNLFKSIQGALEICKLDIPVIVTDHNAYERPDYAPFSSERLKQKFVDVQQYDYMTVLTEADYHVLEMKMDTKILKKIFVLPNPLPFKPQKDIPPKKKMILAAGRLEEWHYKGFDLLINAWAQIQKENPDWTLKIAGGGDQSFLQNMCSDLGVQDRVDFLGFVDIKEYYEQAEIFVLSSRYEGFGMVLVEAMSQGCACVACDYKGRQREIISDENQGIICPPDDIESIVNALRKVILDEDLRRSLQKNAIERSKFYELPNIMRRWNEIFEKIGLIKN